MKLGTIEWVLIGGVVIVGGYFALRMFSSTAPDLVSKGIIPKNWGPGGKPLITGYSDDGYGDEY